MSTAQSPHSPRYQALYQATVQEAASAGSLMMGRVVMATRTILQAREAAARDLRERDVLANSLRLLKDKESQLCARYPQVLLAAFHQPVATAKTAATPSGEVNFDQLELMDALQVEESVVCARAQQVVMLAVEGSLAELNTLICSAQGLTTVRPERNPLRPEVYVAALLEVVEQMDVGTAIRLDWLGAMAGALAQELKKLYVDLSAKLRGEGVVAAGYAVLPSPAGGLVGGRFQSDVHQWNSAPAPAGVAETHGSQRSASPMPLSEQRPLSAATAARTPDATLLTLDRLRRLLAGELPAPPAASRKEAFAQQFAQKFESGARVVSEPATDFDATVPAALEALHEMQQVDQVVHRLEQRNAAAAVGAPSPNAEMDVRQTLRQQAQGVAQALSLEVVTLMVDNMARDPRLLAPVQQLIRKFEPALLRLAVVDPRFFSDKQHPARVLLQQLTHRSLAYESDQTTGFEGFVHAWEQALAPLLDAVIENAEPFEHVLQSLERVWRQAQEQQAKESAKAVEMLQHAEQRNVLAERIAREIDSHPDASRVAPFVIDFLCGPWAQVVAQARIVGGSGSSGADKYQALISALLWSAHPDLPRKNISKLTRLVPLLLTTLREGLESIRYPATKTSAFLESLMGVHQLAFQSAHKPSPVVAVAPVSPEGRAPVSRRASLVEDGDPWVAPEEAKASNFMEMPDAQLLSVAVPGGVESVSSEVLPTDVSEPARAGAVGTDDFVVGSWIELLVNAEWIRTQLTWASPHGTLFLFTSAFGTTQSMTRRSRDKLIAAGSLRLITATPVVEGALDAVAKVAMRNSIDVSV